MEDDCFNEALEIVGDPYVLVNMIWGRMKMLQGESRPPLESLEARSLGNVVLREIIEKRVTFVLGKIVVLNDTGNPPSKACAVQRSRARGVRGRAAGNDRSHPEVGQQPMARSRG
jgi:hypothetical protein